MTTTKLKPKQVREAMKKFIMEGMFSSITDKLFSPFFIPFLISLSYSNLEIGLVNTSIYLALVATKIPGSYVVRGGHKKAVLIGSGIYRTGIILLPLVAYLFRDSFLPVVFMVFVMYVGAELSGLAFTVWFNSLIPEKYKNRYRNKRSMMMRIISLPLMLITAFLIKGHESIITYSMLFFAAFVAGMASLYILSTIPYVPIKSRKKFSLPKNMSNYLAYEALFRLGEGVASSFIAVYFMRVLGKDITWVIGFGFIFEVVSFFVYKSQEAGKIADMNGSRAGIQISSLLISLIPLLILLSWNLPMLILASTLSGIAWTIMDTVRFDYIRRRARDMESAFAVADTTRNLSQAIGSAIGGIIASRNHFGINGVVLVFIISFFLRFLGFLASLSIEKINGEISMKKLIKEKIENMFL